MKFIGNTTRDTVTLHLSFLDEPVTITSLGDMPLGISRLFLQDDPGAALDALLDEDTNHILQHQATSENVNEFFETWQHASEEHDAMKHNADTTLASILRSFKK